MKKILFTTLMLLVILGTSGCSISLFENKDNSCPECDCVDQNSNNDYANYINGIKKSDLVQDILTGSVSDTYRQELYSSFSEKILKLELNKNGVATVIFKNESDLISKYPNGYTLPGKFIFAFDELCTGAGGLNECGFVLVDNNGISYWLNSDTNEPKLEEITTIKNVVNVFSMFTHIDGADTGSTNIYAIDIEGNVVCIK